MSRMPDIQKSGDSRNIPIDKVGVKDISYPIVVMDRQKKFQHTIARINMYVDLPHHFKGTHMSRFIEILNSYREEIALDKLETILETMKKKLGASVGLFSPTCVSSDRSTSETVVTTMTPIPMAIVMPTT